MGIRIKFFASLREQMGRGEDSIESDGIGTVADVWSAVSKDKALPENTLVAVNMEYVDRSHAVKDGDEVAFFPPVTGG